MPVKKVENSLGQPIKEYETFIPDNHKFNLSPGELIEKMAQCSYEFEFANKKLRSLETTKAIKEKKAGVIIVSKRPDLLTNIALRTHFQMCLEDPKFRLTKDIVDDFTYVELQEVLEPYNFYEHIAKQAEKEYDMWQGQLMWKQSENKLKSSELMNKM